MRRTELANPLSRAIRAAKMAHRREELQPPARSRLLVIDRSETAIIGYTVMSLLGAISISYYCLTDLDKAGTSLAPAEPPVYEGRAVPPDEQTSRGEENQRKRESSARPAGGDLRDRFAFTRTQLP